MWVRVRVRITLTLTQQVWAESVLPVVPVEPCSVAVVQSELHSKEQSAHNIDIDAWTWIDYNTRRINEKSVGPNV